MPLTCSCGGTYISRKNRYPGQQTGEHAFKCSVRLPNQETNNRHPNSSISKKPMKFDRQTHPGWALQPVPQNCNPRLFVFCREFSTSGLKPSLCAQTLLIQNVCPPWLAPVSFCKHSPKFVGGLFFIVWLFDSFQRQLTRSLSVVENIKRNTCTLRGQSILSVYIYIYIYLCVCVIAHYDSIRNSQYDFYLNRMLGVRGNPGSRSKKFLTQQQVSYGTTYHKYLRNYGLPLFC